MIISRQNSLIKKIRALSSKKGRDNFGEYIVESVKAVKEVLSSNHSVSLIVATEKGLAYLNGCEKEVKVELVSEDVFNSITTEVTPQGVMAIVKKPEYKIGAFKESCLFLDGVSDPANVGAILRTAASSGYNQIYLADCADPFNPKSVRASMGGLFKVNLIFGKREELLSLITLPIIVADMKGENAFKFGNNFKDNFCLVIGNEANGVSELLKNSATYTVSIPMQNGMESLNAAVSAGILMYAIKSDIGE